MRLGAPLDSRCPDPALLRLDRVEIKVYEGETVGEASRTKPIFSAPIAFPTSRFFLSFPAPVKQRVRVWVGNHR